MSKHTMNRDKRRRNTHRISLAVATLGWLLATAPVGAAEPDSRTGNWGEQCVQQATTANDVADPSELSLFACDRALRKTPQSRERRAAILHNMGVITLAQGELEVARAHFERSIVEDPRPGITQLALAQLAHRQGDFERALELYDELLTAELEGQAWADALSVVSRNRDRAQRALDGLQLVQESTP